jgi:glutamate transport system substrate-binding protein
VAAALATAVITPLASGCVEVQPAALTSDFHVATNVQLAGSPTFQRMHQAGRIVIGVKGDEPDLGVYDAKTHKYSGFDIDIATLVAAGLGFSQNQIRFTVVNSDNRENAIENGSVDLVVGSYSITSQRETQVSFAGPYLRTGAGLMVRSDDKAITGISSLQSGDKVCTGAGSDTANELGHLYGVTIVQDVTYSQCVDDLLSGKVRAVTTDETLLAGYVAQSPSRLKLVGGTFSTELYGVGLPHGDQVLQQRINNILQHAEQDGTWQTIYNQTLGRTSLPRIAPPAINQQPAS